MTRISNILNQTVPFIFLISHRRREAAGLQCLLSPSSLPAPGDPLDPIKPDKHIKISSLRQNSLFLIRRHRNQIYTAAKNVFAFRALLTAIVPTLPSTVKYNLIWMSPKRFFSICLRWFFRVLHGNFSFYISICDYLA